MNPAKFWPFWLLLAAFIAMPKAHAGGRGMDRATGQAIWDAAVSGRTTTLGFSSGAMKIIGPAGPTTSTASGGALVTGTGTATVGQVRVPVNLSGEVAKDAIIGGVSGCATGGIVGCVLGVATPLTIAYLASSFPSATFKDNKIGQPDKSICYEDLCYEYVWNEQTFKTLTQAAQAFADSTSSAEGENIRYTLISCSSVPGGTSCYFGRVDGRGHDYGPAEVGFGVAANRIPSRSPTWQPLTPQEVKDGLYNNNPPPELVDELSRYGNIVWPLGNAKITGPSSVTGPKETSSSVSGDETRTTTSQSTTPISYSGPSATAGNTTRTTQTTTTTTGPDGTTTVTGSETTTTTTEEGSQPDSESEGTPTDTAMPPIPKLYERKYPDGMTGIWQSRKAEFEASPLLTLKDQLLPTLGSGGTCPTMPIDLSFGVWADFGSHDVAPPCWVWDFGKVVVILSAMFLARALIFGG